MKNRSLPFQGGQLCGPFIYRLLPVLLPARATFEPFLCGTDVPTTTDFVIFSPISFFH
jgi:hypothetical protein